MTEYRLAPEYLYPTQFEDCTSAAEYFMKNVENYGVSPAHIVICGESIGGTVAASLVQKLTKRTDLPKVQAQVLIAPFLQGVNFNLLSYQQNRWVPFIGQADFLYCIFLYITKNMSIVDFALEETHIPEERRKEYEEWLNPNHVPKEIKMRGDYTEHQISPNPMDHVYSLMEAITGPTLAPLLSEDDVIQQLPKTFILTCEFDVLRDDGLLYKKRLEHNGVPVSWCHLKDGFHGVFLLYRRWFLNFTFCQRGLDSVVEYVKSL
uniref:Arylacetamide deacetylase-like 4 n=1 Tax=Pogona vitticeps TaxID=103695 RepID=A0ABM5ENW7_9SAUR